MKAINTILTTIDNYLNNVMEKVIKFIKKQKSEYDKRKQLEEARKEKIRSGQFEPLVESITINLDQGERALAQFYVNRRVLNQ